MASFRVSSLSVLLDVEHRKSFSEMTEAQVHPATSMSAPEGFLTQPDNPNGNDHLVANSTGEFLLGRRVPLARLGRC